MLLSFGGASGWSGGEPGYSFWSSGTATAQLAAQLANYVTHPAVQAGGPEVSFDGIDIDYEDTAALQGTGYGGTQFLINLTTDLRALLPANQYLITHAPQTPYFLTSFASNGMYQAVNAQVGNLIDFYNIQFYNNPAYDGNGSVAGVVSAYGNILDDNPGLSATKALLGLPMASGLASTNVFSLQDQANIYSQAAETYSGFGGAMGWQVYAGPNTTALGPTWAANAESAVVAPVPEPSTYAMALAGIACGGFSMWRRRKRA